MHLAYSIGTIQTHTLRQQEEYRMYEAPKLLRFGTFRELTRAGWDNADDHLFFRSIAGCNLGGCPDDNQVNTNDVVGSR